VAWEDDRLVGVEGVIDKDFAASLVWRADLDRAQADHRDQTWSRRQFASGRPGQQWLGAITLQQAREYLAAGEFPVWVDGAQD